MRLVTFPLTFSLILTALLLPACGTAAPPQAPTPTRFTVIPTATPSPVDPPIILTASPPEPTAQAVHPLSSLPVEGALLAVEARSGARRYLSLVDPSGKEGVLDFPAGAHFAAPFLAGVSPGARYFAYFEGGRLERPYGTELLTAAEPDLTLNMLDLSTGEVIFSTPLLSQDYPENLADVAEPIKDEWTFTSSGYTFAEVVEATQRMMLSQIRSIAWSPDGSLLAFASQDPGPSSDLYAYSPESGEVRLLHADPAHVVKIEWSPDSSFLILETSFYDRHAREDTTYLLDREGRVAASQTSNISFFRTWWGGQPIFYSSLDFGDMYDAAYWDVPSGEEKPLWEGSFASIAFTRDLASFLFSANMPEPPLEQPGLYLGQAGQAEPRRLAAGQGWGQAVYWGSPSYAFAAASVEEGAFGITPQGELERFGEGYWNLSPSPGGSFLAGYMQKSAGHVESIVSGLRIFDSGGQLLTSHDFPVSCVRWNAAGSLLALQSEKKIFLWNAADASLRVLFEEANPGLALRQCAVEWVRQGTAQ
jgi:WD40 repeat protein